MTALYDRSMALTIARIRAGSFNATLPNAIVVRDLRVTFTVDRNLDKQPNTATITVYNLAEATRLELERKPLLIRLDVGYRAGALARLCQGDLRFGWSTQDGADWATSLELDDGGRAYRHARVTRSFRPGVDRRAALKEAIAAAGFKIPKSVEDAKELVGQLAGGLALEGKSSDVIDKLIKPTGLSWSTQDGEMQILRSTDVRADQAVVVSEDTGMVGSPSYAPPDNPGERPVLRGKVLLDPRIIPGGRVAVQSRSIDGIFRVERVRHVGDTHGQDWTTEFEAKPLT